MIDPIIATANFLTTQLEYVRHQQWADEVLADIEACARIVAGIARGPAAQKYLGPCGAMQPPGFDQFDYREETVCEGDVYARETASVGRCRDCGAEVSTDARRAWLDAEVRSHAFRAAHIAQAYGVNVKTIRSWATPRPEIRNKAGQIIQSARPAKLFATAWDRDGRPLYNVGDVLDLAAADAARKAEDQARRARRATRRDNAA